MNCAELVFGAAEYGYAGFDQVIRRVEKDKGVYIDRHNFSRYKWDLLVAALKIRPKFTDVREMASIIKEITGIDYALTDLIEFEEAWEERNSNTEA